MLENIHLPLFQKRQAYVCLVLIVIKLCSFAFRHLQYNADVLRPRKEIDPFDLYSSVFSVCFYTLSTLVYTVD